MDSSEAMISHRHMTGLTADPELAKPGTAPLLQGVLQQLAVDSHVPGFELVAGRAELSLAQTLVGHHRAMGCLRVMTGTYDLPLMQVTGKAANCLLGGEVIGINLILLSGKRRMTPQAHPDRRIIEGRKLSDHTWRECLSMPGSKPLFMDPGVAMGTLGGGVQRPD